MVENLLVREWQTAMSHSMWERERISVTENMAIHISCKTHSSVCISSCSSVMNLADQGGCGRDTEPVKHPVSRKTTSHHPLSM